MTSITFSSLGPFDQDRLVRHNLDSLTAVFADERVSGVDFQALTDEHGFATVTISREEFDWEAESLAAEVRASIVQHSEGLVTFQV